MIEALISLVPGGWIAAAGVFIAAIAAAFLRGRKSERNAQRARDADAYEQHLKDTADAHNARNRVDPGVLPVDDPYRRD